MGIIPEGDMFQISPKEKNVERDIPSCTASFRLLFIGLLCKVVSTSATFVFTMDAIASCLQPILCHGTVALNVLWLMHLVVFHLDISAEMRQ
ncbi:hypothetical protein TNCT_438531 [Trichonephila clavata]|uniref:Uncharacterized protein n=1 Tax=Trichonephila clavata TaxID=2740835 RepID=A0A8X6GI23_TRICU|nr:hypothetical protein TNCT_438531 [Trichonephila clavata]